MMISRVCGLVLPTSTKYLIDNVIGKQQLQLLLPLVLAVLAATIIQGITVFRHHAASVESRAAPDRRTARARCRRTSAACRSPTTTANKTGTLVSRIMTDVDGIRNLLGTGLIEFARRPPDRRCWFSAFCCASARC